MEKVDKAIPYLKPSLKDARATMEVSRADQPVLRDLKNGLLVAYIVDSGDVFEYVQVKDLDRSRLTEEELHSSSVRNLAALMNSKLTIRPYGNVFAVFLDGNVESSLLLVDELWDKKLAHLRQAGFIAVVPTRDVLAFCDASDLQGVTELRRVAERAENGDHLITPSLFRRAGTQWLRYDD